MLRFSSRTKFPKSFSLAVILIGRKKKSEDFFSTTTTLLRCSYWLILAHITTNGVQKIKIKIFKSKRPRDISSCKNISKFQRQGSTTTLKRIKPRISHNDNTAQMLILAHFSTYDEQRGAKNQNQDF